MIEKMKVVHIVAAQTQKTELLDALRALGIVHFAEKGGRRPDLSGALRRALRLITVLEEQGVSEVEAGNARRREIQALMTGSTPVWSAKSMETERAAAVSACDTLAGWGQLLPPPRSRN